MNKKNDIPLKWITCSFYFVFVILPDAERESKLRQNFARFLDCFVVGFLIYLISCDMYLASRDLKDAPFGFMIFASIGDFTSLFMRVVLIRKRRCIGRMLRKTFALYRELDSSDKIRWHGKRLFAVFVISWILPSILFAKSVIFDMSEGRSQLSQIYLFFGNDVHEKWSVALILIINFLLNQQIYVLPGFCVGLCFYSYNILAVIVQKVEKVLKKKSDLNTLFDMYLNLTQKVTKCVNDIEHALSLLLLFVYSYIVSCIFIVITLLFKVPPHMIFTQYVLINAITLVVTLMAFYAVSIQAVSVNKASVQVGRTIHNMCSNMLWPTDEKEDAVRIVLLIASDEFSSKILITGYNLFSLNQNFVLQTTGAIISYGTVIAQLGTQKIY
ncbi:uncharacterized protein CDAR_164621 [Caerostris darwini]|uniref:Odorant receptor n=1 Tax=Caerostris darwini TaxID=1538125 RepID=A0AAV4QU16_9ARAC|nr:uncharacterized protein CDAR_164621 [Caerostris darwini]